MGRKIYLLRCIIALWNCKCFMIKGDVCRWELGPNESASDPCTPIFDRAQKDKGSKNQTKQHGLHPCIQQQNCFPLST
ncbi:hypothetical protein Lal_00040988 [Lupinus albus]|nr:hypothetical protein Lal_00040988 [Lupinus albus]